MFPGLSEEEAAGLGTQDPIHLPPYFSRELFTEEYNCTVLIYEFNQSEFDDKAELRTRGKVSGREHLEKSGIWEALLNG